jgi:hypothetical protein
MPFALFAALAGSLVLHAAALMGTDIEWFGADIETPPLRAELRAPPPTMPVPPPAPVARTQPAAKAAPIPAPATAPAGKSRRPVPAPVAAAEQPADEPVTMENAPEMPSTATDTPAPAVPQLPAAGAIRFAIYKESLGLPVGRAEHRWEFPGDGSYRLNGVSETSGLVAVFKPVRMEMESRGRLVAGGLRPDTLRTTKNGRETTENADFDWSTGEVRLARDGSSQPVARGTQDILSLNYQLAFLGKLEEGGGIGVVTGKKYAFYALDSLGEEVLETPAGRFRTLHLRAMTDSVTEVWIALDRQRLPVKIRFTDKKGESFVQVATELEIE